MNKMSNYFEDESFQLTLKNAKLDALNETAKMVVTRLVQLELSNDNTYRPERIKVLLTQAEKDNILTTNEIEILKKIGTTLAEAVRGRTLFFADTPVRLTDWYSD